jgi:hypothetical protein
LDIIAASSALSAAALASKGIRPLAHRRDPAEVRSHHGEGCAPIADGVLGLGELRCSRQGGDSAGDGCGYHQHRHE